MSFKGHGAYMGTSLIRKCTPLGPYCRTMPGALWGSLGGLAFYYVRGTPELILNTITPQGVGAVGLVSEGMPAIPYGKSYS